MKKILIAITILFASACDKPERNGGPRPPEAPKLHIVAVGASNDPYCYRIFDPGGWWNSNTGGSTQPCGIVSDGGLVLPFWKDVGYFIVYRIFNSDRDSLIGVGSIGNDTTIYLPAGICH